MMSWTRAAQQRERSPQLLLLRLLPMQLQHHVLDS